MPRSLTTRLANADVSFKTWLAFWLAALFWGTSFLWIKLGLQNWNPVSLVCFRLLFASFLFGLALAITRKPIRIPRSQWWVLPVVAFLNPFCPFIMISWAEVRIDSGVASILNATVPLFTLVLTPFFLPDERPTWRIFLGTTLGFLGVALLFGDQVGKEALHKSTFMGEGAVLLASLLYAGSAVLLRRHRLRLAPIAQAAVLNGLGCVYVWIQALATGDLILPHQPLQWAAVVWLGALGSFSAYSLAMYVLEKKGATQLSLINFAYPVLGLALGFVFLNEPVGLNVLAGTALILMGIGVVQRR